jgi:type I restriction enzyme, S subunit
MNSSLPQGWKEKELGSISLLGDGAHSKIKRLDTGVLYLTSKNIKKGYLDLSKVDYISKENYSKYFDTSSNSIKGLKTNDILVGIIGSFGTFYLYKYNDNFGISSSIGIIRANKNLVKAKYLMYIISSKYFNKTIEKLKGGSVQGYTNLPTLKKVLIPIPPLNEQKRIADILSAFDDKIELNYQMNQTLEDMATTLFKEWFIDNESNNWKVRTLGSLGKVITGKTPSTKNKDYWGDGIFFITPTDFKNYKKYAFNSERSLSILGKESSKRIVLPKETILVTCIGSDMGKVVIAQNECISNQQINALIIDNDYLQEYVYQYLKHIYPHLRQIAMGGSTMPIINKSAFENIEIILPPIDLLKKFQDIAFSFNQIIIKNTKENQTLKQQRDTLLPKLMSGEIRV